MKTRKQNERGYALLMVFLLAAIVALFLYAQIPRVAFESERDKEQALIDRGEQYKRGIQLYVIALKKYPQKIEDLEDTNNKRYLRRRYIDPFTGKDEWRLIHTNAAGQLTDSLVQKPPTPDGKPADGSAIGSSATGSSATSSTASSTTSTTTPDPNAPPPDVNAAVRRRPSDVVGQAYSAPANADPNDPSTWAPITVGVQQPGGPGAAPTGQPPSGAVGFNGGLLGQTPAQMTGQGAGAFPLPGQPGFNPGQNQFKIDANGQLVPITPTQPGLPGQTFNPIQAAQNGQPVVATGGINAPGMNPMGNNPSPAGNGVNTVGGNAVLGNINSNLTNPNPLGGNLGQSAGMASGGIAGVASTHQKGPASRPTPSRRNMSSGNLFSH